MGTGIVVCGLNGVGKSTLGSGIVRKGSLSGCIFERDGL